MFVRVGFEKVVSYFRNYMEGQRSLSSIFLATTLVGIIYYILKVTFNKSIVKSRAQKMNDCNLPNEIIHDIVIKNLTGKEMYMCRAVCRRWKHVVDELGERIWAKLCKRDYSDVYQDAYDKSRLSWHELYKSLFLWSKLKSATMKHEVLTKNANHLQILRNGNAAVAKYTGSAVKKLVGTYSDAVVYFDLETSQEHNREAFDFIFSRYAENDNVIAVVDSSEQLWVVPKESKKRYIIGKVPPLKWPVFHQGYELFEDCVYFRNIEKGISVCKVNKNDVDTTFLTRCDEQIVSFSRRSENETNVLTKKGNIYSVKQDSLKHCSTLALDSYSVIDGLTAYGFNWISPSVYKWLFLNSENDVLGNEFSYSTKLYLHGNIVVYGRKSLLQFYYNPCPDRPFGLLVAGGGLDLQNAQPVRSVNLEELDMVEENEFDSHTGIDQIEVVEVANGHKVLVSIGRKIIVLEFTHATRFW